MLSNKSDYMVLQYVKDQTIIDMQWNSKCKEDPKWIGPKGKMPNGLQKGN